MLHQKDLTELQSILLFSDDDMMWKDMGSEERRRHPLYQVVMTTKELL